MTGAFTGLFALGLVVLPGISYRIAREFRHQEHRYAVKRYRGLRETALLLIPGLVFSFVGVAVFGAIRGIFPSHTPDVGLFLLAPGDYFRIHLPYMLGWIAGLVAISCALAYRVGKTITWRQERRGGTAQSSWADWLDPKSAKRSIAALGGSSVGSSDENPGAYPYVECLLTDGTLVTGFVMSFNEDYEESQDRDLCFVDPQVRQAGTAEEPLIQYDDETVLIVSASRIQFLTVAHLYLPGDGELGADVTGPG
ncbi:DUF6338 family protein [Candidatus Poriferisocius sp.]|uniref:DUF6338 family protein n=1 Tax=Candidatus Poriferisocius sp. TaxID=3101276 RepID=UPI003B59D933